MSSPASKDRRGNRKLLDRVKKGERKIDTDTTGQRSRRSKYGARLEKLRRRSDD